MAMQLDPSVKDDLKTQFVTREGTYRLMTLSEYSRPNRVGYTNSQSSPQVRVSIVSLPNAPQQQQTGGGGSQTMTSAGINQGGNATSTGTASTTAAAAAVSATSNSIESRLHGIHLNDTNGSLNGGAPASGGDRICFNFGKELYVYAFRGVKKGSELSKPIDKKLYKGTNPSCHDFNSTTATPDGAPLLVGFTTGQIQLAQPGRQPGKLYNEERLIDKTKVTCLKWLPGSPNLFLASHASGHLYLYNEELPCTPTAPNYQPFKMGDGYTILTCKSKSTRNPLYKWVFGTENCSINEFCFSPCGSNLAIVSQDGFLRVFHYDTMELLGIARSYFGGFLCVCWSPDGKYIVVGGEDDLVTVWSLHERRVVARGQGHRSWVSVVAFDPYTTSYTNWDGPDFSDDENPISGDYRYCGTGGSGGGGNNDHSNYDLYDCEKNNCNGSGRRPNSSSFRDSIAQDKLATSYRLGSVSQDTQLCLWDITEDVLRHPLTLRQRVNSTTNEPSNLQANGDVMNDVKVIKPIATTNTNNKDENGCNTSSKNSSNSSSSKFSTANCTISSSNDSGGCGGGGGGGGGGTGSGDAGGDSNCNTENMKNSSSSNKHNSNKQSNCIGNNTSKSDPNQQSETITSTTNSKSSSGSSSKSDSSGLSAFNSLTQRLSNFTFGSEKKSMSSTVNANNSSDQHSHNRSNHHRKTFSLSKSSGNYHSTSLHHHNSYNGTNVEGSSSLSSLKNSKSSQSSTITTYDPMKLIGTPACPRFDECPLLEPLICKKIAHERLTALIFREDCFLTACQDGFIYTWARPGYSNVPQHMSPSPSAPPGGTVV